MDKATDTRLCEIRSYIDNTKIRGEDQSILTSKDLLALGRFTHQDFYGAILLAFAYGRAKGYRAATDTEPRQSRRLSPRSRATAPAERVSG